MRYIVERGIKSNGKVKTRKSASRESLSIEAQNAQKIVGKAPSAVALCGCTYCKSAHIRICIYDIDASARVRILHIRIYMYAHTHIQYLSKPITV